MELNWLEDFLVLAEIENFSRAAESRHVSQPAFSRRIRALEEWTGSPLFDRSTHRVRLTEAGRQFQPLVMEALRSIHRARETARQVGRGESAVLRLAATHALSFSFFPEWLRDIERRSKIRSIRLISDSMQGCEQLLIHGQAQFLLCYHHDAAPSSLDPGQFISLPVGQDQLVPAVAAHGPDARRSYLAYSTESGLGRILHALGRTGQLPVQQAVFTSHLAAVLRSMVCEGRGMAWLPLSLIREDLEQGRLIVLQQGYRQIPLDIRLFRPRSRQVATVEEIWSLLGETQGTATARPF